MERHPRTGKSIKQSKGFNCVNNCPIPKLIPENMEVWNLMTRFGNTINTGMGLSSDGIKNAMEWSNIDSDDHSRTAEKVVLYYTVYLTTNQKETKKDIK